MFRPPKMSYLYKFHICKDERLVSKMEGTPSDVNVSRLGWLRAFEAKILASASALASSIWPRPDLNVVNLASKNVLSNAK